MVSRATFLTGESTPQCGQVFASGLTAAPHSRQGFSLPLKLKFPDFGDFDCVVSAAVTPEAGRLCIALCAIIETLATMSFEELGSLRNAIHTVSDILSAKTQPRHHANLTSRRSRQFFRWKMRLLGYALIDL
jgi:hypothetical protein